VYAARVAGGLVPQLDQQACEPQRITRALVGGPSKPDDKYKDDRGDYIESEVSSDFNIDIPCCLGLGVAGPYLWEYRIDEIKCLKIIKVRTQWSKRSV
jgi:hypothetical protein